MQIQNRMNDFTIGLDWIHWNRPVTYRWDKRTWYGTKKMRLELLMDFVDRLHKDF